MDKMRKSILDVMKKRRSTRKYKKENVSKDLLLQLIEAAIWAPSGSNVQPWYFIIVDDANMVEQVNVFSPGLLGGPPSIILICSDRKRAFEKAGTLGRDELCVMDISMAAQNIMLLAEEIGLSTCPVKSFNKRAISKILNLPDYVSADLIISVGYSGKITSAPKRRIVKEVTFFNTWGAEFNG
jgi:nitroreductase